MCVQNTQPFTILSTTHQKLFSWQKLHFYPPRGLHTSTYPRTHVTGDGEVSCLSLVRNKRGAYCLVPAPAGQGQRHFSRVRVNTELVVSVSVRMAQSSANNRPEHSNMHVCTCLHRDHTDRCVVTVLRIYVGAENAVDSMWPAPSLSSYLKLHYCI